MPSGATIEALVRAAEELGCSLLVTLDRLRRAKPSLVVVDEEPLQFLGEQRHLQALRFPFAAAFAEDVLFVAAVRADVRAHILDDAQHRHLDLLERA